MQEIRQQGGGHGQAGTQQGLDLVSRNSASTLKPLDEQMLLRQPVQSFGQPASGGQVTKAINGLQQPVCLTIPPLGQQGDVLAARHRRQGEFVAGAPAAGIGHGITEENGGRVLTDFNDVAGEAQQRARVGRQQRHQRLYQRQTAARAARLPFQQQSPLVQGGGQQAQERSQVAVVRLQQFLQAFTPGLAGPRGRGRRAFSLPGCGDERQDVAGGLAQLLRLQPDELLPRVANRFVPGEGQQVPVPVAREQGHGERLLARAAWQWRQRPRRRADEVRARARAFRNSGRRLPPRIVRLRTGRTAVPLHGVNVQDISRYPYRATM